ncbi:hypothetical protein QM574_00185 [Pantoea ananatis]|jgi:hypothetical protein|uniref:hypothetical protein n=1 Tax=Pantoea TaxID=53335 RepID=UPI0019824238|nr:MULTISPECIES: hypothetical protein [Pantoea]MDJ0042541.1 hypothetical protein [Pantoea allii]MDJ0043007.1 hypothetical protein [Pantoea ananatis]
MIVAKILLVTAGIATVLWMFWMVIFGKSAPDMQAGTFLTRKAGDDSSTTSIVMMSGPDSGGHDGGCSASGVGGDCGGGDGGSH